jgi:hypothetical protein
LRIELLHFEGCPGSTQVLGILKNVVIQKGFAAEILPVIPNPDDRSDFPGSPTILVNGEDLFPAERRATRATSCRIYATPESPKNHPTATMVREALVERLSGKSLVARWRISPRL